MIDAATYARLQRRLPFLTGADPELVQEILRKSDFASLPAGRDVFLEGDQVDSIALLLSGIVRVYKIGATGREITLYRFGLGESCILTANAILSRHTFPAIATVEKDAQAVMVPAHIFREWVSRYDVWRTFVFDLLSRRLASVMEIVEEVAFQRMDKRVASLLLERSREQKRLRITHQEIAAEMGSSREVISRILEAFASQGIILPRRGSIEILDSEALNSLVVA